MMKYYSGKRRDEELEGWLAVELKAGLMSDCNADGAILYMCFGSKTIRNHWYGHLSLLTQYNNMKYGPPSLNPTLISTPRDYYSPTLSQAMKNTPLEYEKLWENLVIYNTEDSKNTVHTGIVYSGYLYKKTNKNALFQRVFCILTSGWLLEFEVPNFSDRDSMASMINAAKKSIISKDKAKQSKTDYKKEIDHIVDKVKTNLVKLQEAQDAQDAQDKHRSQQKNKKKSTAVPEHGDSSEVPNIHHRSTQNELRQNEGVSFQETETGIIEEPNYLGGDVKIAHFLFKHSRSIDLKDVYVFSNPPNCFTRRELSDAPFLSYYSAVNAQNGLLFGASDLFTRMPNLDTNSAGSVLTQNGGQGANETSTQPLSSPEYEIGAARNPSTIQNNFEQAEIAHGLSSSGKFLKLDPVNHTFALWKPFKRKMDMNLGTSSRKKVSHLLRSRIFVPNAKKSHTSPLPERCTNESDVQNLGSRSPISVIMPLKTMCTINSILGIRTSDESSGSTAKQAPADAAHTGLSYNGYKPELGVAATPLSNRPSYLTLSNFEIQIRFPVSATILRPNTIHGRSFTPKTLNHTKPSPTDNNYGLYEPDHECALLNKNKGFTAYTAREFLSALMVSTPFEVAKPFLVKYRLAPATATSWVDMAFRYLDFSDLKQIHASVVDRGSTEGFASLKATSSALDTSINPRNMRVSLQFGEITQVFNDRNNDDGNVFYTDYGTHGVDLDSSIATQRSGGCSTSERYSNRYSQGVQADGDPVIQLMHRNPFDFVLENFGEKLVMQNTSSFVDKAPEQSGLELSTINRRFSENIHSSRRDPSRKIFEPNYHTTSASLKYNKKDEKLGANSKFCLGSNISNNGTSSTTGKVPVQHASFVNPSKSGIQTTPGASTCCSHDHSSAQTLPFDPTNIPLMCLNPLNTDGKISAIMKRNSPADESSLFLGFYIAESKLEMESWINYLNSHIAGINML
ncbi:hypothetical protein AX774_g282 [Zancudomyces culisetae]|uniref:PH domain-containing protein n=1 Tax=Zancudomyces culisetae TaxID=1213189 RepID=A0A1R1PYX7_ZANCU|nr:hypothetical protein AX774_g282 [Zancudomyces culisetae]|eukprot:OMH86168.1 hypothetical protein AX774_g282 [Zancudomyces culisetae]